MTTQELKVLLIQFRADDMKDHEYEVFLKFSGLQPDQVIRVDALNEDLEPQLLDRANALILGGAGDYLVSEQHIKKEVEATKVIVLEARRRRMPMLGICFGGHIMTEALGGTVVKDIDKAEVGTFEITKTKHAEFCPIFSGLPNKFHAQLGHKDHVAKLPDGAVSLASSRRTTYQAYTFPGEPIYALTFHPELDKKAVHARIDYYKEAYVNDAGAFEKAKNGARETPHAIKVVRLFLERIVAAGEFYGATQVRV